MSDVASCPVCRALLPAGVSECATCGQVIATSSVSTLNVVEFVVLGDPIPQGSMRPVRRGVMVSDNPRLSPWRKRVTAAAREACGPGWTPWDGPVAVDAIFTVARPKSQPATRLTFPAVKPDLDKLTRAIGDSLCPREGFKLLAEDSRIVEFGQLAKTYPSPMNTHPGALTEPGVRVRIRQLGIDTVRPNRRVQSSL